MKSFRMLLLVSTALSTANTAPAQNWMLTSAPTNYWQAIAASADGTKLAAVTGGKVPGPIYLSKDTGSTWTANDPQCDLGRHCIIRRWQYPDGERGQLLGNQRAGCLDECRGNLARDHECAQVGVSDLLGGREEMDCVGRHEWNLYIHQFGSNLDVQKGARRVLDLRSVIGGRR